MRVVNLKTEKYTVYIGRGSNFGNPFKIGIHGNREEVIKKYEKWARTNLNIGIFSLSSAIYNLTENAILGCYCKPKDCHGDIIIKIWKELHEY